MATGDSSGENSFVETILTCRICRYLFDDKDRLPKILGCMHTICDNCIRELAKNTPYVQCPFCKNTWKVPANGFPENTMVLSKMIKSDKASIQPTVVKCDSCLSDNIRNDAEGFCNDCEMPVCSTCIANHKLLAMTRDHDIQKSVPNLMRRKSSKSRCRRHNTILTVFCSTCQTTICNTCFITGHNGHKCTDLHKAVDEKKALLVTLAEDCKSKLQPIHDLVSAIEHVTETFNDIRGKQERHIDEVFNILETQLAEQRTKAKQELLEICERKNKILKEQKDEVNRICEEYQSASEFAEQLCQLSEPEQLLELQQQV